jgi:hypothetical protein
MTWRSLGKAYDWELEKFRVNLTAIVISLIDAEEVH